MSRLGPADDSTAREAQIDEYITEILNQTNSPIPVARLSVRARHRRASIDITGRVDRVDQKSVYLAAFPFTHRFVATAMHTVKVAAIIAGNHQ